MYVLTVKSSYGNLATFGSTLLAYEALRDQDDLVLGAIRSSYPDLPALLYHEHIAFAVWDQSQNQGHLVPSLMLFVHGLPFDAHGLISGTRQFTMTPTVVLKDNVSRLLTGSLREHFERVLPTYLAALEAAIERYGGE